MITEDRVMMIFVEANPAPDVDALTLVEVGSAAYLATLEQRSSEMTQLDTQPTEQRNEQRPPMTWLVAAAAVIVIGVALILINQSSEEAPVVTEPTPTPTTVAAEERADPRIEEGLAVGTAYAEAEAALDLPTLEDLGNGDMLLGGPEAYALEADGRDALGWTDTVQGCAITSSNALGASVTCTVIQDTAFSRALGVDPVETEYTYVVRYEGEILAGEPMDRTRVVNGRTSTKDWGRFADEAWEPFVAWIEENHPDDVDVMFLDHVGSGFWAWGRGVPAFTAEANKLWRQYTTEFVAIQKDQ